MTKEKVKAKGIIEADEAIEYLRDLLRSIENRSVVVETEERSVSLDLPDHVKFEVEAERKDGKGELEFEISWKEKLEPGKHLGLRFGSGARSGEGACLRTEFPAQEQPPCAEM